jgi:signal transduction protein with GAF and PtsI domain
VLDENTKLTAEINSLNETTQAKDAELNEANAKVAQLEAALEQVKAELQQKCDEFDQQWQKRDQELSELYNQKHLLEEEIAKYQLQERLNNLETALQPFNTEELNMAQEQIDAYKADPMNHEVSEVVDAIYIGIGKKNKEAAKAAEQNQKQEVEEPEAIESVVEPEKNFKSSSIF